MKSAVIETQIYQTLNKDYMKTKTSKLVGNRHFLYCLLAPVVRFFGLKGSWKWAVKEMKNGKLLVRTSVTGAVKYRLSTDEQSRLEWDFNRKESEVKWENANFFISDMMATDWVIYNWC